MVHMINPINVIHCIIDCVCLVHIIIKFSAIFDLNNDEKKEPNISRASWLATIKVHFFENVITVKITQSKNTNAV